MVWSDTVGSMGDAYRPAAREAERHEKDLQKVALERSNARDIEELETYINQVTSLHHETVDVWDWVEVAKRPKPKADAEEWMKSDAIRQQLTRHDGRFVQWLQGKGHETRAALDRAMEIARTLNQTQLLARLEPYHADFVRWETEQIAAHGLLNGDDTIILSVIRQQQTLSRIHKLGRELGFSVQNGDVHAVLTLHDLSIVPDFQFKYLPSGKLTEVKMPREKMLKLYRAYVASAALKVASDLFALLPHKEVFVSCIGSMFDPATEREEKWPVLSVKYGRERVKLLDMEKTDPVAALKLFEHAETFHPVNGMARVIPILDIPARLAI